MFHDLLLDVIVSFFISIATDTVLVVMLTILMLMALQFIAGGLEISLVVAIDFTGSNGDPSMPESLHYVDPVPRSSGGRGYNSYEQAIVSVGQVGG